MSPVATKNTSHDYIYELVATSYIWILELYPNIIHENQQQVYVTRQIQSKPQKIFFDIEQFTLMFCISSKTIEIQISL